MIKLNQRQKLMIRRVLRQDDSGYYQVPQWIGGKTPRRKATAWQCNTPKGGCYSHKWQVNCHLPTRYSIGKHKARMKRA